MMQGRFCVAVVDDDPIARTLLANILERDHEVLPFDSGEALLAVNPPVDAVLLDIEMRGMDGFDVCRHYRMQEEHGATPVLFVSAHDTPDQRLAAFEAGGDDFIIKPIVADEVRHKVHTVLEQRERIRMLAAESEQARRTAVDAVSSVGDLGRIIDFMRHSARAGDYRALAEKLREALQTLGLKGILQIRGGEGQYECATDNAQYPLQQSVLDVMRDMGRIFELGSRGIVNFPHVSLLIQNMPVDDSDRHGRIRDLLTVLGESADAQVAGIDLAGKERLRRLEMQHALTELETLLGELEDKKELKARFGHILRTLERFASE